jgi:pterin-4a-carbinolamine dehydratase
MLWKQTSRCYSTLTKLTPTQRKTLLTPLMNSGWKVVEGRDAIIKSYTFKDFNEAFGFMTRVALKADRMNHHPEWLNVSPPKKNRLDRVTDGS